MRKRDEVRALKQELASQQKLNDYIDNYVPVNLELPERKLATSSEYFDKPKQKGFLK